MSQKRYIPQDLPVFASTRAKLPRPVFDERPDYVECYWRAWELAFEHFRRPMPGSPFVSNYIDEGFNDSLFLWDTAFMTMFCNYAHPYVPGICSLDNFYCTQLPDGEIVREVGEADGVPNPCSRPGTPDSLNHPILAWAERESFRISADRRRLGGVYEPLVRYYHSFEKIRDAGSGLYLTSWASMDNSPRIQGMRCGIDTAAEMVLFARDLAWMARVLGNHGDAQRFEDRAEELSTLINDKLWDEVTGFYYDWAADGRRHNVRTIAAYWTLLAGVADEARLSRLVEHLQAPGRFLRAHMVPTVPADEQGYHGDGHYWRGGVWTPTNTMVIRGLERCGRDQLARSIALNHLGNVVRVFKDTGTMWEFYAPDEVKPGVEPGHENRRDFVGWTGIAPIVYLLEHAIGIQVDAPSNTVTWDIKSPQRVGVYGLWFGGRTVSLVCEAADANTMRTVALQADQSFQLRIRCGSILLDRHIPSGNSRIDLPASC